MAKIEIEPRTYLFPMPAVLVGATVNGKPNFLAVAYCGMVNFDPPMVMASLAKAHYTNIGIREHKTFSVNVPSAAMARAVDYCGQNSGHKVDKSELFEVYYGKFETAPLIAEAPLSLECKLVETVSLPIDEVFIGEIVGVHCDESVMTGGAPDPVKIDPLIFSMSNRHYYRLGAEVGPAWSMGKDYKK